MAKLTDNQLASLYLKLANELRAQRKQNHRPEQIYSDLLNSLHYELQRQDSGLYGLEVDDQRKVYTILNTLFSSSTPIQQLTRIPDFKFVFIHQEINHLPRYYHPYYPSHDWLFTWLLLDSISHHNHPAHHHRDSGCCGGSSSSNRHKHDDKNAGSAILFLLLLLLVLSLAVVTLLAAYYLLRASLDSFERLWYNEGRLQALIDVSSAIASTMVSGFLATLFASAPLTAFALAAGVANPVGVVVFSLICISLIGGALGCFLTRQITQAVVESHNKDALDPKDPYRFTLSPDAEVKILQLGLDPVKVKCALVALHEEIGESVPTRLHRLFANDHKQELLEKVRELRSGNIKNTLITIGKGENALTFDLRPFPPQPVVYVQSQQSLYPEPSHAHAHRHPGAYQSGEQPGYEIPPGYGQHYPSAPPPYNPSYNPY
ncbi:hypothetical protein [Legionella jordanis]|uniref:Uncharacterized protein n=1 Tax=Legionella jordanis TaxID=456 RepID=A0A0W0V995_9GAMM|nr:hypothetical protein [Legionella jordanis]KTD16727.1 hypothetical protein Ljor_1033 [Legionella jordanis]RMX03743.1 hypothetical protein EAW55_05110 [Legionella jordanis]RMX22195.1 hypothetical protein EAS68_01315 [Legionella jordanis]VEH11804.1 Uncharacterised protein [Legionella jordanis]HAT8712886.1 hypothetical protein [Legionella jordanis]